MNKHWRDNSHDYKDQIVHKSKVIKSNTLSRLQKKSIGRNSNLTIEDKCSNNNQKIKINIIIKIKDETPTRKSEQGERKIKENKNNKKHSMMNMPSR